MTTARSLHRITGFEGLNAKLTACWSGTCDCRGGENCKFPRCRNCDAVVNFDGKWIDDDQYHRIDYDEDRCPYCGAPFNA